MKLPEDKNERKKVLALIGIATVAVLYGTFVGVFTPLKHKLKDHDAKIIQLTDDLRSAELAIAQIGPDREGNRESLAAIVEIADAYVLVPRLGNYLLGTVQIVEACAERAGGVGPVTVNEIGISEIPDVPQQARPNAFKAYSVRVRLRAGLDGLVRLLREIENENPYACVSNVEISADEATPATHNIVFEIQWPIWADQAQRSAIRQELRKANHEV